MRFRTISAKVAIDVRGTQYVCVLNTNAGRQKVYDVLMYRPENELAVLIGRELPLTVCRHVIEQYMA